MNNNEVIANYYRDHRDEWVSFADSRIHCTEEAEDLVQEVFMRLLTGDRLISTVTLPALVYKLCQNRIIDWYRRHAVRQLSEKALQAWYRGETSAWSDVLVRDIRDQVEHSLQKAPVKSRELFRMHLFQGLQVQDICQETGDSYKSVEYQLGIARKIVRTYFRKIS